MKVAILGYGTEGQSAYRYWSKQDAEITICDAKADLEVPKGVATRLGPDYLADLTGFDLIVRSPGIRPHDIQTDVPVTSVISEFMAKCPAAIIGVTGTKGKGTTSTLITKILEAAGHKVWLGGNIGVPALDFLDQVKPHDWVVLELSSFQLIDATKSPHIAVGLMIAPEHLNYHLHMEEYIQAKGNIFRFQGKSDIAVYYGGQSEPRRLADLSPGQHIPYFTPEGAYVRDGRIWFREQLICQVSDVGLIGRHNLQNVCAAVAATWGIVEDAAPLRKAIGEFKGLPHRLEFVNQVEGVKYFDDSIATTPETTMAAMAAFLEPKVLIMGGSSKGAVWHDLAEAVQADNVTEVIAIGDTASQITAALDAVGYTRYVTGFSNMPEVVAEAHKVAVSGGVVLLSPGCASFDMFRDYKDRGDQFKAAVKQLEGSSA